MYLQRKQNNNNNNNNLKKFISKIPYPMKTYYNSVIPLNIFQTWHTKNLPPKMFEVVNIIKQTNPAFKHFLFDDNDCRNFIKFNYDEKVLNAYDSLIPGAYKADLWRYCILYKLGGIYLDIKYYPLNGFKFINLTEKEHFVLDADKVGIYNALMVCLPGNKKLEKAINKIINNVKYKYYGTSALEPTGPRLLRQFFLKDELLKFDMHHEFFLNESNKFIFYGNFNILKSYTEYKREQNNNEKTKHYSVLWNKKNIYK